MFCRVTVFNFTIPQSHCQIGHSGWVHGESFCAGLIETTIKHWTISALGTGFARSEECVWLFEVFLDLLQKAHRGGSVDKAMVIG